MLILHQDTPRVWTREKVERLVTVAERTRLALENARLRRGERRQPGGAASCARCCSG
jgi:GAF domain-containing protein